MFYVDFNAVMLMSSFCNKKKYQRISKQLFSVIYGKVFSTNLCKLPKKKVFVILISFQLIMSVQCCCKYVKHTNEQNICL